MRASLYNTPEPIVTVSALDLFVPTIEISNDGGLEPSDNGQLLSASHLTKRFPGLSSQFNVPEFAKV